MNSTSEISFWTFREIFHSFVNLVVSSRKFSLVETLTRSIYCHLETFWTAAFQLTVNHAPANALFDETFVDEFFPLRRPSPHFSPRNQAGP